MAPRSRPVPGAARPARRVGSPGHLPRARPGHGPCVGADRMYRNRDRTPGRLPAAHLVLVMSACGGGNALRLTIIDASIQRPSNVAVYFTVDTAAGEPVPGLTAEQFKIYEDGSAVSILESKQTILNPEVAANHYTLLLIDMSGSVTESGDVPVIVEATRGFADRVQKY